LVVKGTYIDETGRTRDAGTNAIIMPGFRRIPPAADMTYVERLERHNAQLEAESNELRLANKSMQNAKNKATSRVAELETQKLMMMEELDRLRSQVAVISDESRSHEISNMFLKADCENLHAHVAQISGQNAALAAGMIGMPIDAKAGKLYSANSISDANSDAYKQHVNAMMVNGQIPALPTIPLERAKYPIPDRVTCLLAKVGVAPGGVMTWDQCAVLQGAVDATEPAHQGQLEQMCKDLCADGLKYEDSMKHFSMLSSSSLARAEKTLGLTTVHYHPFVYDPIGQ
jgi:hypothetical protein